MHHRFDRAQCQAGYDYAPPPADIQLRPQGGGASKPQADGGHGHDSDDPLAWLRESVPGEKNSSERHGRTLHYSSGEPGVDYPIYNSPPDTGFSCEGRQGLYSDTGSECQAWHVCLDADRKWSFLCPNGTIFNQEVFTCVWWFDFDCTTAESFYSLNDDLYSETPNNAPRSVVQPRGNGGQRPQGGGQSQARPATRGQGGNSGQQSRPSGAAGGRRQQGGGARRPQGGSRRRPQVSLHIL